MRRTALTLIALCTLCACTERSSTTAPRAAITEPPSAPQNRQSVRGVMRIVEEGWMLETSDGSAIWLVGGPVETYPALEGKEVIVVGVYRDGALYVETCGEYEADFNRRT